MSEKAESPLGRLCLRGIVTEEMYEAGNRYAVTVGAYRSVIGAPAGLSGGGSGGEECSALCNAAHKLLTAQQRAQVHDGLFSSDVCRCLRKKEQYDSAYEALSAVGQRPAKAVARLAVHREEIAREDLVYLVIGLNALARHFGLTQGRPGA